MPQMPVSLVISLLLALLVVRSIVDPRHRLGTLATTALCLYALQCVLLGLRWGYDITLEWPVQAALAALIPGFTWLTLRRLVGSSASRRGRIEIAVHTVPSLVVLAAPMLSVPLPLDWFIIGLFLGYGVALLAVALSRDIAFVDRIPFQGFVPTKAAFVATGLVLIGSGIVDIAVVWDMNSNAGALSGDIVGYAQLLLLGVLSVSVVTVGALRSRAAGTGAEEGEAEVAAEEDHLVVETEVSSPELERQHAEVVRTLDAAMAERHLYRDPNLSLERLARKVQIPARQISSAINANRAMNVSQYVNTFRVREACRLLRESDLPITTIIFDVGFQTKSNFNREFRRLIGQSPTEWRRNPSSAAALLDWSQDGGSSGFAFQEASGSR